MSIQNKHQEHFEDLILTGDLSVLEFLSVNEAAAAKVKINDPIHSYESYCAT